jgi:hypothetical protein
LVRQLLAAAAALAVVGGCSKPLTANDMPRPKAGLWTWVDAVNGVAENTGRTCLGGKPVHILGPACPQITYARASDGVFETENRCPQGAGGYSDFKDRFSGDFQASYVMDQSGVVALPGKPPAVRTSRVTYTFAGACPAGLAPDDD